MANHGDPSRLVLCPHISLSHYRGGEKWVTTLANRLVADGVDVSVRSLPYVPDGERRVEVSTVLDDRVSYEEAWHHDLSAFDTAYVLYVPLSGLFFRGAARTVAGIHSWVYVSDRLYEPHYGAVPTAVKALYRTLGERDLGRFDTVHAVTPAFDSPHPDTRYIPNFVDTDLYRPDRAPTGETFTVLVTAAHIPEKGWDLARKVARALPDDVRFAATGTSDDPNVHDLGFLDEAELADAYARAHLVLHPARVDTDSMVLNEACASGTPVVTSPLPTHVDDNDAVMRRGTVDAMVRTVRTVHREWRRDNGYARRCRIARMMGEAHDEDVIYPRLKRLLLDDATAEAPP
ncbi:glycosyltransferase family 4 protein [Halomarina oriensis]|uniref:Glycosyltransferase n=1 Tax=Halomarina oriensis TaxID=671145 RepID=A0A6B0GRL4_9EURY|nr:glycosyltransferase [Halomarina oriensis]MWG35333.1 glycosyltransferase [Halomarina oriensis]